MNELAKQIGKEKKISFITNEAMNGRIEFKKALIDRVAILKGFSTDILETLKKNININCISPGFIKTAMTEKIDEKFKETIVSKIPSARLGEPDDIANAVLFLASSQSDYVNGETLHVNGGMYMAWQSK